MELLSPAGNLRKLEYAYRYGADAAYIGIGNFSLRQRADNFHGAEAEAVRRLKEMSGEKRKLYCTLNIFFHQEDIRRLEEGFDRFSPYPFDAWIISDLGVLPLIRRHYPQAELHLSTQANCLNAEAVKMYRDLGFSRIILGRETPLKDIESIKTAVPEVELEVFVHGAMCLAYSGRCFLSRWMAERSANQGRCSHSCRWTYRVGKDPLVLEEQERPGEFYPIEEFAPRNGAEGYTTILSSRDLCMIDHLRELRDAGVDSLKIEGRMKSLYYTAMVTRAYRKALDHMEDPGSVTAREAADYRDELFKVSHREYSTGFFFDKEEIEAPTEKAYQRSYTLLGTVGPPVSDHGEWKLEVNNKIRSGEEIEFVGPDILYAADKDFVLIDEEGEICSEADHGKVYTLRPSVPVKEGYIIRRKGGPPAGIQPR